MSNLTDNLTETLKKKPDEKEEIKRKEEFKEKEPENYLQQKRDLNLEQLLKTSGFIPEIKDNPDLLRYEDDYLLILNKPAGMLVHPTVKEDGYTLYNYVERYFNYKYGENDRPGLHPVLRLDRNTSGLVIFAKQPFVQTALSKPDAVKKEYLALVQGKLPQKEGSLDFPIARKPGSIIERCVSPDGKACRTDYKVLKEFNLTEKSVLSHTLSLVKVRLHTGRTHQIRVHFSHIGSPLWHDNLYGTPGPQMRHGLHAFKISFTHPVTGKKMEISCDLPKDLKKALEISNS